MEKQITLSLEDYNELLKDKGEKEKLENAFKINGYLVKHFTNVYSDNGMFYTVINYRTELQIISKDEVLCKANEEIKRLEKVCIEQNSKIESLKKEIRFFGNRGFFKRIFNVKYKK